MPSDSFGLVGGWNFAGDRGNITTSVQHSTMDGMLAVGKRAVRRGLSLRDQPDHRRATLRPETLQSRSRDAALATTAAWISTCRSTGPVPTALRTPS